MRTNLAKIIKSPSSSEQLVEARGQLAPFLRDTLVGLNYAYYEPPGAQILHHNPLFVRSHDFAGDTVIGLERVWQAPQLFGAGSPAGGAHTWSDRWPIYLTSLPPRSRISSCHKTCRP